ncbi:MAG: CAP domain-containing protein [Archangium sp.]
MTSLLIALVLTAAPTRPAVERTVRERFEAVGRSAPEQDVALSRAADELAQHALKSGVADAAGLLRVTAAISRQGAWDPNPVVIAIRASGDALLGEIAKQDLGSEPSTHVGIGFAGNEDRSAVIILLAQRRVDLAPFPRVHARPVGPQRLCLKPAAGITSMEVFVTRPQGAVDRMLTKNGCASPDFQQTGRHAVEVLASSARGPEVVALFFVDVGAVKASADEVLPEPGTDDAARAALLVRTNALRLQHGAQPLQMDASLQSVAQLWAERLAREGFFSHVAPDGSTLRDRLTESGYRFATAGENLGLSTGALAAHFGIEHSPGHRNNLLEAHHRRVGFGLATRPDGLRVLVELLANPLEDEKDPLGSLYASIADERKRRKLPPMTVNPVLEALAQEHARTALKKDTPKAQLPGVRPLHDRAFEAVDELASISVDIFVADTAKLGGESKNLLNAANRVVGVGVAKGDSERYGNGRYWIVVLYGVPGE